MTISFNGAEVSSGTIHDNGIDIESTIRFSRGIVGGKRGKVNFDDWIRNARRVSAFRDDYGDFPRRCASKRNPAKSADEVELGKFVNCMRDYENKYNKGLPCGIFTPTIRNKISEIVPGLFENQIEKLWMSSFDNLKAFAVKHGRVPLDSEDHSSNMFARRSRHEYRNDELSKTRIAMFEALGEAVWDWEPQKFAHLIKNKVREQLQFLTNCSYLCSFYIKYLIFPTLSFPTKYLITESSRTTPYPQKSQAR